MLLGASSLFPIDGSIPESVDSLWLRQTVERVGKKYGVPGMSAAVLGSGGVSFAASWGVRKYKSPEPVEERDLWHLGSDTKMMTASLAALCVERGELRWNSTVDELFGDDFTIREEYRSVTLIELLSHRSGAPANIAYHKIDASLSRSGQRREAARMVLSAKPAKKPGSAFLYSNAGYVVAGAMIEKACGADWETLMTECVFAPLGMTSAGFGGLGTKGLVDQPWGHTAPKKPYAVNGPLADNPPVIGPAGTVHCTIDDWALFIVDQLRGARGLPGLLKSDSYGMLQSPHFGGEYGMGWACVQRDWAGGLALTHTGSNTMYTAVVWAAPEKDVAVLVCTNEGKVSANAADEIVGEVLRHLGLL